LTNPGFRDIIKVRQRAGGVPKPQYLDNKI
jgi:hypothetical protein